ncbi:MAG TPA: UDP-N-acetylmuramate--L-alanine ligase [Longimicrobiales bacterium]|nr:UDP-N-acetylmuramate--L-alanine ligase [Longimicrobiales bacterium]
MTDAPRLLELEGPVHFVGIGGAGMYALAELAVRQGLRVTGCDAKESAATRRLKEMGVPVQTGHDAGHVTGAAAVVTTAAVPADHPELRAARTAGIPVWKRAQALGQVVNRGRVVAVAGTHGKTSTTALTVHVLAEAGLDPTGLVGGSVPAWGGNLRAGGDLFVVEADEYDRSFHTLEPDVAVVTNLEADHLDIYGDYAGVRDAFHHFLGLLRPGGRAVLCADDSGSASLLARAPGAGYSYGLSAGSQLRAVELQPREGGVDFRILEDGVDRGGARLPVPGDHNLRNALAAAAVARIFEASWDAIRAGWESFTGVGRRFQRLGEHGGVVVLDDYAHHPTEIAATLGAVRETWADRRVVAVFQPHLYSRTRDFALEFGEALAAADQVWVTDVFPAREDPIPGVDGGVVARAVARQGTEVREHPALEGLAEALTSELRPGDLVVTLGAGSIEKVGPALVALLEAPARV